MSEQLRLPSQPASCNPLYPTQHGVSLCLMAGSWRGFIFTPLVFSRGTLSNADEYTSRSRPHLQLRCFVPVPSRCLPVPRKWYPLLYRIVLSSRVVG